jgi:hypothetical protein
VDSWIKALLAGAAKVDWPKVIHTGAVLVRSVRGDTDIERDHEREIARVKTIRRTGEQIARAALGCTKPDTGIADDCAICREEREP